MATKSGSWGKSFLQKQKRVLENKLIECLEQRKRALGGITAIERDELKDPIDLANAVLEQEMPLRQAKDCTEKLFQISQAILKIKNGIYGICNDCEGEISIKRLKATPWVEFCIECQKEQEETR